MTDKDKDFESEFPGVEPEAVPGAEGQAGRETTPEEVADEIAELKSRLAYLAAEFDNYRKRVAREKDAIVSFGNERLLLAVLPFLDNLERAISQAGAAGGAEGLVAGVRITYDQILSELRKFGLEPISAEGEMFDPNRHEAISMVPWEGKPEGMVVAESRKGYLLNGRLLRPSQVAVAQSPAAGTRAPGDPPSGDGRGN